MDDDEVDIDDGDGTVWFAYANFPPNKGLR